MKDITKTILVAAMILPFGGMRFVAAKEDQTKYSRSAIDKSFKNSEDYVSYENKDNQIKVNEIQMIKDGLDEKDIEIMMAWARLHNKVMKAYVSGDKVGTCKALVEAANGPFGHLTNAQTTKTSAVGELFRSINKMKTVSNAQTTKTSAVGEGTGNVSRAAPTNTTGYGGRKNGEFRDENHMCDTHRAKVNGVWYEPVPGLLQVNKPNPDPDAYDAPTFWWDVYVAAWHHGN